MSYKNIYAAKLSKYFSFVLKVLLLGSFVHSSLAISSNQRYLNDLVKGLNADTPRMIDKDTRLERMWSSRNTLYWELTLVNRKKSYSDEEAIRFFKKKVIRNICKSQLGEELSRGTKFQMDYRNLRGRKVFGISIKSSDCRRVAYSKSKSNVTHSLRKTSCDDLKKFITREIDVSKIETVDLVTFAPNRVQSESQFEYNALLFRRVNTFMSSLSKPEAEGVEFHQLDEDNTCSMELNGQQHIVDHRVYIGFIRTENKTQFTVKGAFFESQSTKDDISIKPYKKYGGTIIIQYSQD